MAMGWTLHQYSDLQSNSSRRPVCTGGAVLRPLRHHEAPGRPTLTGTTHHSVSLTWGKVTAATHYDARYRDRDAGGADLPGSWSQVDNIRGTSHTFTGLTADTRYEFEVRAGNNAGDSGWSPKRYATTTAAPPIPPPPTPPPPPPQPPLSPAPTITNVVGYNVDAIQLVWDTEEGVTRYQVRYRVQGVGDPWILDNYRIESPRAQSEVVFNLKGLVDCTTTFEIEVRGKGNGVSYNHDKFGDPTIETGQVLCPLVLGHQGDHTVLWEIGSSEVPVNIMPPLPAKLEDPENTFVKGIPIGADAWDDIEGMSVCNPCRSNDDEFVVTINAAYSDDCVIGSACVDPGTTDPADGHRSPHFRNLTMTFEHNVVVGPRRMFWTLDSNLNNEDVPMTMGNYGYYYIGWVMIHEFGHTLGIGDFYRSRQFQHLPSVMNRHDAPGSRSPTINDRKHLREIYRAHSPHGPIERTP